MHQISTQSKMQAANDKVFSTSNSKNDSVSASFVSHLNSLFEVPKGTELAVRQLKSDQFI